MNVHTGIGFHVVASLVFLSRLSTVTFRVNSQLLSSMAVGRVGIVIFLLLLSFPFICSAAQQLIGAQNPQIQYVGRHIFNNDSYGSHMAFIIFQSHKP